MVQQRVGKIAAENAGKVWNGVPPAGVPGGVAASCHLATCYWILYDILGTAPTLNQYLDWFSNPRVFSGPEEALKSILNLGKKLTRPAIPGATGVVLTAGSVIMFVCDNGVRIGHSCVAITTGQIGGYNQANWFWTGEPSVYSTHNSSEFRWRGANFPEDVETNVLGGNQWAKLKWVEGDVVKRSFQQKHG
jgi:hypothetical protein